MSKIMKKMRIVLSVTLTLALVLAIIAIHQSNQIKGLRDQVELLQRLSPIKSFDDEDVYSNYINIFDEEVYILTYEDDVEGKVLYFIIDKDLEVTMYDVLLTRFPAEYFSSWDGENYYFEGAMTNVDGLDETFYDEWGLIKGLQAILINDNFTVEKFPYPEY